MDEQKYQRQRECIEKLGMHLINVPKQEHQDHELNLKRAQVTLLIANQEKKAQVRFKDIEQEIPNLKTQDEELKIELTFLQGQEKSMQDCKEEKIERISKMKLNMSEITKKMSGFKGELRKAERTFSEAKSKLQEISDQLEQYEGMAKISQYRQQEHLKCQLIIQKQELGRIDVTVNILNEKVRLAVSKLSEAENKKDELLGKIEQAKYQRDDKHREAQGFKEDIDSLMEEKMSVQNRLNQKKGELTVLKKRREESWFWKPSLAEIYAKLDEVEELEKEKIRLNGEIKEKERDHRRAVGNAHGVETQRKGFLTALTRTYNEIYTFSAQESELEIALEKENLAKRELERKIALVECELELGRETEIQVKERIANLKEKQQDYKRRANDSRSEIQEKRKDIIILKAEQGGKEKELEKEEKELVKTKKSLWEIIKNTRRVERMRNAIRSEVQSLQHEQRTVQETLNRTENDIKTAENRVKIANDGQITQQPLSINSNVVQAQMERRNRRAEERIRNPSMQVNSHLVKYI